MADEGTPQVPATDVAAPTATAAPVDTATQQQAAPQQDEVWRNTKEIKETIKRTRELEKLLPAIEKINKFMARFDSSEQPAEKESKGSAQPDTSSRVAELERTLALKDAFSELGVTDPKMRELISLAVKAANPENVREFVGGYVGAPSKPAPASAPASAPTNTGAPAPVQRPAMPQHPSAVSKELADQMSPDEAAEFLEKFIERNGPPKGNPFARKQRPGGGGTDPAALAQALAQALGSLKR